MMSFHFLIPLHPRLFNPTSSHPASSIAFFRSSCPPMPSSSTQAACSSSCSFSDYAEAFAQYVMRFVQTLRPVVEAAARSAAGYYARLPIGQVLRSAENRKSRDSRVQFLEEIARGNRYSDANSLALMISRRIRRITNWERGDLLRSQVCDRVTGRFTTKSTGNGWCFPDFLPL